MYMPCSTDVAGVQRLNGFVNYLAIFLPGLSDVMEPIRQLTTMDVPWNWSKTQEDACQTGLGAALLQDGQPLAFVSRALTVTETR